MQTFGWVGLTAVCEVRGMQLHRLTLNVDASDVNYTDNLQHAYMVQL